MRQGGTEARGNEIMEWPSLITKGCTQRGISLYAQHLYPMGWIEFAMHRVDIYSCSSKRANVQTKSLSKGNLSCEVR